MHRAVASMSSVAVEALRLAEAGERANIAVITSGSAPNDEDQTINASKWYVAIVMIHVFQFLVGYTLRLLYSRTNTTVPIIGDPLSLLLHHSRSSLPVAG
jgi:hypothetical protein